MCNSLGNSKGMPGIHWQRWVMILLLGVIGGETIATGSDLVGAKIGWRGFLARHDMVWRGLPGSWREAPWTGNGMLGSMFWHQGNALRIQAFRGDVQAHRPMTQGFSGYTRSRLQIGSHYLAPAGKPTGCDLRLSYYDGEVVGAIKTTKGELKIRHFTHAGDMAIVTELETVGGEGPVKLTWQPDKNAMPTRRGYARNEKDLPKLQRQYMSKYPTEPFWPNPDAVVKSVDGVNVCIQDMLGVSRHCTAWKMIETGKGKQRLVVSIANRWPKETNDPVSEAVTVVKKVCALKGVAYDAWKQKHYDWWHAYYPASFVSVPDTEVETVYYTTMYKLGSATRADRVMIDTAGIWQTPSKWADSHWDFNIPYCYYPMPTANRLHLAQSLIRNIDKHRDNLVKNVRPVEWQADSSYLPVCTGQDLYQPKDVDARYFQNTGGHLVWAMHACWLIYRGAMDDDVLRDTVYPILRRAANYINKYQGIWGNKCDFKKIYVWSPLVKEPVAVRYAWATSPMGNLKVNGRDYLPLHSFRTDNWDWPEAGAERNMVDRPKARQINAECAERFEFREMEEAKLAVEIVEARRKRDAELAKRDGWQK